MLRWGREHQAKEKEVLKEKRELAWSKKTGLFFFPVVIWRISF